MEIHAYTRSIKDILTLNRKYIIPRFQREYSWEKAELKEFLDDTLSQINRDDDGLTNSDYFIGSIVLVGNETKDVNFNVVDGQQRLTTITIFFSVLTQLFKDLSEDDLMDSCYSYIEGKDDDNKPYFKLVNESPKPFLQHRIQNKTIDDAFEAHTDEEKKLLNAYNYFYSSLDQHKIARLFLSINDIDISNIDYVEVLKAIREQVKRFTVIFITVGRLEDANTIFETLNAKGKDLEAIDLIKNEIFKVLKDEHPTDSTKDNWKSIKNKLIEREERENITVFLRHFWLSKYSFTQKAGVYNSFKKLISPTRDSYKSFLDALVKSTQTYITIISPLDSDWPRNEKKVIYDSLVALNIFNVSQTRPIVMALLETKEAKEKVLKHKKLVDFLSLLEAFHFKFTAISSGAASGLENAYSRFALKIRNAKNASEINVVYDDLKVYLKSRVPSYEIFSEKFKDIIYTNKITRHHKLIRYLLKKIETQYNTTQEYAIKDFSLEHISDQSIDLPNMGCIGNLLPLSQEINSRLQGCSFQEKLIEYDQSQYKTVQKFVLENKDKEIWNEDSINLRTAELSELAYNFIWKIE